MSAGLPEAIVAVLRRDDQVLVIRRAAGVSTPGYWTLPSGRIEPGEQQPDTVVREMREELGVTVRPLAKVWECRTDTGDFLLHWWTAHIDDDEFRVEPAEVAEARWVTPAEFAGLDPVFVGDQEFFERVLPTVPRV